MARERRGSQENKNGGKVEHRGVIKECNEKKKIGVWEGEWKICERVIGGMTQNGDVLATVEVISGNHRGHREDGAGL